jgi:oxaloacetate decarboxylase alpha subunit
MSARVDLVDTTVRDGHQSLWSANALSTAMIAAIAPTLDRAGFHAIDFTSSTHMAMAVRWHREDPWERIRVIRELMSETPLGFITPGMRFIAWERATDEFMRVALRCVIRNGIRRVWIADPMNDVDAALRTAAIAKDEGATEVLVGLVYSVSPVHTDEYYASRADAIAADRNVDVLNLKDPGGLLTPERAATLVPSLRRAANSLPLEVHTHETAALGAPTYLESARHGAAFLCTACSPLANGTSQPSTERTVANLRAEGFDVPIDDDAVAAASMYFTELAAKLGRPVGVPREHDVSVYRHQLPGGMTSTLQRQLAEVGLEHRWHDVLDELPRVREELGWPIMVTPLSQFVGVQALLNVTTGERWSQLPDEVVRYVLGNYGTPPGEIDPTVREKALASPLAESRDDATNDRFDLDAARELFGSEITDEELLLRVVLPPPEVDAIGATPSGTPSAATAVHPIRDLVAGLVAERDLTEIEIEAEGMTLRARTGAR